MTEEVLKDLYRGRWRRAREALGIVTVGERLNPGREGATGGLLFYCSHAVLKSNQSVTRN